MSGGLGPKSPELGSGVFISRAEKRKLQAGKSGFELIHLAHPRQYKRVRKKYRQVQYQSCGCDI